jgi:hypothetical protein
MLDHQRDVYELVIQAKLVSIEVVFTVKFAMICTDNDHGLIPATLRLEP